MTISAVVTEDNLNRRPNGEWHKGSGHPSVRQISVKNGGRLLGKYRTEFFASTKIDLEKQQAAGRIQQIRRRYGVAGLSRKFHEI
jgi:hypothetical protein